MKNTEGKKLCFRLIINVYNNLNLRKKQEEFMDIFTFLSFAGGLALFLFGMQFMGDGLKKLSGSQLESILGRLTSNKYKGLFLGLFVTSIIQSSSATMVMLVGFVNSGIMTLSQTIGPLLGANIGTTATAWLLSTTGLSGNLVWLRLLKPESFTPILAVIGVIMNMSSKSEKGKDVGSILMGFAVLMFGMTTMSDSMSGLKDNENFTRVLVMLKNPIFGILSGTILTAIIMSSSASVGVLQAFSLTGAIPMYTAIPFILGANIGAAITPVLASFSANRDAKRVALACVYTKIISVIVFSTVFFGLNSMIGFDFMNKEASVFSIALFHTSFNVAATLILIPFSNGIEKLTAVTLKGADDEEKDILRVLDDRFLSMPGFALEKAKESAIEMIKIAAESINISLDKLFDYDEKTERYIKEQEKVVDNYEDKLGSYLVRLAGQKLDMAHAAEVTTLLHIIGDIERISDHACNILKAGKEMHEKKITFSDKATAEIEVISAAVREIIELSVKSVEEENNEYAMKIEPLEQVVDKLKYKMKRNHIERLQNDECTIELGFVYSDIITNLERIADHCSNIGVSVLQREESAFEPHEYLSHVKNDGENDFISQYDLYKEKYRIK